MNITNKDWEEKAKTLLEDYRAKARVTNRFVDLEEMAVNVGEEIKQMILQG